MYKTVNWNTGAAAERFRFKNKKSIKGWRLQTLEKTVEAEATSSKQQAPRPALI